ncbi:MAG: porin family protein [Pseudomonadales bacterium]|nr:porin family protein [Pseudomonadales bacterium]
MKNRASHLLKYMRYQFTGSLSIGCLSILCVAATATAEPWYIAAKFSAGYATIDDITDKNSIGTGIAVLGVVDGEIPSDDEDDIVAGIGFSIGKPVNNWAIEAEFIYRYRTDWDVSIPTPAIRTVTNLFTNIETTTLMLNVLRVGTIYDRWHWEAGAGIGMAYSRLESEYIERARPGITVERVFDDDARQTEFAWSLVLGLNRKISERWLFNIRYQFIDLGDLQAGPYPMRNSRLYADWASHEVMFSLRRAL